MKKTIKKNSALNKTIQKSPSYKLSNIFDKKSIAFLLAFTVFLTLIVSVVHITSLSANALMFDDDQYLINNQLVKNPGVNSAMQFLTEILRPSTVRGYYQPLAMISLMCDYAMGGSDENFMVFHRTSLILHVINTCLIMLLLFILFKNVYTAALTALIFGVHPMTVETIAWVGERKTTLAAFFALLCLIVYVLYSMNKSKKYYYVCLALYVLALMSKPTSTMIPIAFLLLDYWPLERINEKINYNTIKSLIFEKIPFFIITFFSAIVTYLSQKYTASTTTPGQLYPPIASLWRVCHNLIFYPVKMIYPKNLSSHYPVPDPLTLANPEIFYSVFGSIILVACLILSLKKTRIFFTGFGIFFMLIFPTMGVIGFTIVIASDKYAYLPVIGLLLITAKILTILWDKFLKIRLFLPISLALFIFLTATAETKATQNYLSYWQTTEGTYRYMINLAPKAAILYGNLGIDLGKQMRFDEAIDCYLKAINLNPNYTFAYNNLGNAYRKKGNLDEAVKYYYKALEQLPNNGSMYYNLAIVLTEKGDIQGATNCYKKALECEPNRSIFWREYGMILIKQQRNQEGLSHLKKALELNPRDTKLKNYLLSNKIMSTEK